MALRELPLRWATILLSLVTLVSFARPIQSGGPPIPKRVALVLGNAKYGDDPVSGVRDAEAMITRLESLGFLPENIHGSPDGDLDEWNSKIKDFGSDLQGASLVVVFFSGHGFSVKGENYLLPRKGEPLPGRALPLHELLLTLAHAPDETPKLVFINACRNSAPPGTLSGLTKPDEPPKGVVLSFAAGPGKFAESGQADPETLAPYVVATLRYFGQPGLRLVDMLAGIHHDVTVKQSQEPQALGFEGLEDFFVREPVTVDVVAQSFDDDLSVVLNGEVVLDGSAGQPARRSLPLRAGRNDLTVLVANHPSFQDHQSWQVTEGWSYRLRLFSAGGMELELPNGQFAACEHHPFKNGPRHGGIFPVARAELYVDPSTAELKIRDPRTDLYDRELPFYARNQGLLYSKSLKDLDFESHPKLKKYLSDLSSIRSILKFFNVGAVRIPDTSQLFAQVRGNYELLTAVETCLDDPIRRKARQEEVALSVDKLLNDLSETRPFGIFERGLSDCVREVSAPELKARLGPEKLLIWSDFSMTNAFPALETCEMKPL